MLITVIWCNYGIFHRTNERIPGKYKLIINLELKLESTSGIWNPQKSLKFRHKCKRQCSKPNTSNVEYIARITVQNIILFVNVFYRHDIEYKRNIVRLRQAGYTKVRDTITVYTRIM